MTFWSNSGGFGFNIYSLFDKSISESDVHNRVFWTPTFFGHGPYFKLIVRGNCPHVWLYMNLELVLPPFVDMSWPFEPIVIIINFLDAQCPFVCGTQLQNKDLGSKFNN